MEPKARLVDDGFIEIRCDARTVVTRRVKEQDKRDYPEIFAAAQEPEEKAPKRGRPRKVKNDAEGSTGQGTE